MGIVRNCAQMLLKRTKTSNNRWGVQSVLFLPSATKLRQGNIFRNVCQEFCPQGRVSASVLCWDTPPPGRHPLGRHTPWADTPPGQTPLSQQMATAADGTHPTEMRSW